MIIPTITLRRLSNKPVLRKLPFLVPDTCQQSGAKNSCGRIDEWETFFLPSFTDVSFLIEPEIEFGSFLSSS